MPSRRRWIGFTRPAHTACTSGLQRQRPGPSIGTATASSTARSSSGWALTKEARESLAALAMVDDIDALPRIPWSKVEDDHSEDRMQYSFLADERNREWVRRGHDWVMRRIGDTGVVEDPERGRARRQAWIDPERPDGIPFRVRAVQAYQ
jgi:hypothetical protein